MPVTFYPSTNLVEPICGHIPAADAENLLRSTTNRCGKLIQSSFESKGSRPGDLSFVAAHKSPQELFDLEKQAIHPVGHGHCFVDTAIMAYNNHHHLVIRPDDIWMSILSQFSLYVNANPEELRRLFVQHEGKKVLRLDMGQADATGNFAGKCSERQVDFGIVTSGMAKLIQENIVDPELRDWFLPTFSTTTETDRVVASAMLMATLKEYFTCEAGMMCGLSAVTLLGDRAD